MKLKSKIDPMKGVVNPDLLIDAMKRYDKSYIRGALQVLTRKPPNPYIVPILRKLYERI